MHRALSGARSGTKKIRVNAISAGPIKTLAARGISGLGDMLKGHAERAPLQRNVEVSRSRQHRSVSRLRREFRHHRRNHLRGLRLQHHGVLKRRRENTARPTTGISRCRNIPTFRQKLLQRAFLHTFLHAQFIVQKMVGNRPPASLSMRSMRMRFPSRSAQIRPTSRSGAVALLTVVSVFGGISRL